jgi:sugar phosphate isomerase/epimerase
MVENGSPMNKKFVGMRGTSIPTGGGWENLPMSERLRQTFERGLTRVELDLADAFNKKIMPGQIPEAQRRISKQIASEFGAAFSVHAPYQVDISSQSWAQRTEAAEIMRQSIKYAKDMGAKYVTFHPTANLTGASFLDPFTLQATPVPAHFMMRSEDEFKSWCKRNNIKEESPVYEKLHTEAGIMFNAQAMQFTQHYAAAAPTYSQNFGSGGARNEAMKKLIELRAKGVSDQETLEREVALAMRPFVESQDPNVAAGAHSVFQGFQQNPTGFVKELQGNIDASKKQWGVSDSELKKELEDTKARQWQFAAMASGGRIGPNGQVVFDEPLEDENSLFRTKKIENFAKAMTLKRQIDLTGVDTPEAKKATGNWIKHMNETFEDVLKNKDVKDALKSGVKLSIENLWGINPEQGLTDAAGYFNKAEHMAEAVRALQKIAEQNGLPKECITMTFDTEHAAIGSQTNPTEFMKTLQEKYPDVPIGHVHLVGGGSQAAIFGHKGFGSIEDDIARKNPELLKRLIESGAPITIEPGSGGIKDVEEGLSTLLLGAPLEALQAAGQGGAEAELIRKIGYLEAPQLPGSPDYTGKQAFSYFGDFAAQNQALVTKSLYSFGPSLAQPFRATYGAYSSPSLYQGGISHMAPGTNIWGSSQPLLYSMRPKE